ncbi:hypothetical protein QLQ12_30260 [Actinoplanes sp. NEAU-A12]|uniref:FTP domain-containing protein n=1 Tax=Actinoplanes sandaracinus TaxID=3045177 RepID=A0ABT6WH05_9ACTN|nr:hypothetical protein [Actinoplanes sandaracinus]MDI6099015.1 hypothetical protein [Actinoplanes sandaracinus]MDI6102910.1 hypothetical protein [Actinoplanes sandaracinus]
MSRRNSTRLRLAVTGVATVVTGAGVALVIAGTHGPGTSAQDSAAWKAGTSSSARPAASSSAEVPGTGATTGSGRSQPDQPDQPSPAQGRPSPKKAATQAKEIVVGDRALVRGVAAEDYQSSSALVEKDGSRHVRFDRTYRGLEVLGGDFIVHSGPDGRLRDTTLTQSATISVSTTPDVTAARAAKVAEAKFTGKEPRTTPTLVVDAGDGAPRLAWRVLVEGLDASAMTVVVDATTGAVRRAYDNERTEAGSGHGQHSGKVSRSTTRRADGTFELIDPDRGGSEVRDARGMDLDRHGGA